MASANPLHVSAVHRSLEHSILLLAIIAGLPAGLALLFITWNQQYTFEVRWTMTTIVVAVWVGCAALAYQMVTRALFLQANLLGALREGDYSIRGAGARPGSAVDLVMHEINALGDTLQRQRTEAVESTALLRASWAQSTWPCSRSTWTASWCSSTRRRSGWSVSRRREAARARRAAAPACRVPRPETRRG